MRRTIPGHILTTAAALTMALASAFPVRAQEQIYFVDGFHGGIYGHYPVMTYTDYMCDLLDEYPQWKMCLEIEPETWDTVKVKTPEAYGRFAAHAVSDRVEFTNPTYAQPYMYNISGESIIRQFSYGMEKMREHFPDVEFSTYAVEEPCFTSALPQILRQFGFSYASLKCPNTCWGGYTSAYGGELVNWTGPDGSSILASPRYACEALQTGSVWQTTAWGNKDDYIDACRRYGIRNIVGMCYQDAGWRRGPWLGYGDNTRNRSEYVTWREYFEEKSSGSTDDSWHFTQEDIHPGLMWGSQVLNTIARQVRRSENLTVQTEKAGVIAYVYNGVRYRQEEMDEAWRTLMLAQHHDSWIVPYNRLGEITWAENIALWTASSDGICNRILSGLCGSFDSASHKAGDGTIRARVINTSGFPRHEPVSVILPEHAEYGSIRVSGTDGKPVPSFLDLSSGQPELTFMADVPAFGFTTYSIEEVPDGNTSLADTKVVSEGRVTVSNGMYRIVFDADRGGVITSLVTTGPDETEFADNTSDFSLCELRGYFHENGGFRSSTDSPAVLSVTDKGLSTTVEVRGEIAGTPFVQTFMLKDGDRKIEARLRIDWNGDTGIGRYAQKDAYASNRRAFYEDRYKLNLLFPVFQGKGQLYKDAPFDVCKSELENTYYGTWDSIKHNVVLHWVDVVEEDGDKGLAVLTDHTGSYSYGDSDPLCLTVQFSGNGLWGRHYGLTGPEEISYAIIPHLGDWREASIYEESCAWNEPLKCTTGTHLEMSEASFIDVSGTGYEISAAYVTDRGIVLRLFNASGDGDRKTVGLGFPVKAVMEADPDGNPTGNTVPLRAVRTTSWTAAEMEVSIPPFGIRTWLIEYQNSNAMR